jgi:gliding motility-associated lipoprotein GldD
MIVFRQISFLTLILFSLLLFSACEKEVFTPKPIAYPRIHFPEKGKFLQYNNANCPYTFKYPAYAKIELEKNAITQQINPCWFNLHFKDFNATIYLSYKEIGNEISLEKVLEDAHKLKNAHNKKADYIDEAQIKNKQGVEGEFSEIGGNVATNVQFYLSDFEQHYIRGSLYFEATPNIDSVQPIVDFIKADMLYIFETFEWK